MLKDKPKQEEPRNIRPKESGESAKKAARRAERERLRHWSGEEEDDAREAYRDRC